MSSRHTHYTSRALSPLLLGAILVVSVVLSFVFTVHTVEAASAHVDLMLLNSDIGPAATHFLKSAIATAESDGARALVIEIDTPGGDLQSMKDMTQAELSSTVPIIAYVSPAGGRAASAGAFIALSAPLTFMAPATRIGASSPIQDTGQNIGSTLLAKIENDLVTQITGVQARYHRNLPLAALMVTKAAAYDDITAIKDNIVNFGAVNLNELLNKADGQTVTFISGRTVTLQTAGVAVNTQSPGIFEGLYGLLLDPNVAFLLFIVAIIGIYLEISHPGMILPGVVGGIALVLFLFAAGSLSPNWAGLVLMLLALALLILDVRLPTHGVLTVGAVISLVIGSLLFFNSGGPTGGPQVNPLVVYIMAGLIAVLGFTLVAFIVRSQRSAIPSGVASMIGAKATVLTPLQPGGRVSYGGEDWAATLESPFTALDPGTEVQITAVEGLHLLVRPTVNAVSTTALSE
ncbi:MAG: nodulation protein NfeD [Ktedonobacteraceae bacterium]|nr:nodulation protein NfeD [Ktedonobacteraceae bacterium]